MTVSSACKITLSLCLLLMCFSATAQFKAGTPDSKFGKNGYSLVNLADSLYGVNYDFIRLPDSSFVVTGQRSVSHYVNDVIPNGCNQFLLKYKYDGSRDSSFMDDGMRSFSHEYDSMSTNYNTVLYHPPTQKTVLVSGFLLTVNHDFSPFTTEVRQLQSNGQYDSSFGINGKVVLEKLVRDSFFLLYNACMESGGKILITGQRYKPNG